MIYIGNDIIEVSRIKKIIDLYGEHFMDKIFSDKEIRIINAKNNNPINISGKFSAKEASKKALLSSGLLENIPFKNIQILNKDNGNPYIELISFKSNRIRNFQISISHTKEHAIATAVLELS